MHPKTKRNYVLQAAFIVGGLIGTLLIVHYSGITEHITLEKIQMKSAALKQAVDTHYVQALLIYVMIYTILIAATLPVVGPLTMLGGYVFGLIPGFIAALVSATCGATLSFLIIRYALGSLIRNRYKARLERFNEKIKVYGYGYLLTLQIVSIFPYVVINTLAALTDVSLFTSFWTTLVGSAPLIFMYALAGRQLSTMSSVSDILSPHSMLILALLALVGLLPMIVRYFKKDASFEDMQE